MVHLLDIIWIQLLFLVLNSKVLEIRNNKIIGSCNVIFFENISLIKNKLSKLVTESFYSKINIFFIITLLVKLERLKEIEEQKILVLIFIPF